METAQNTPVPIAAPSLGSVLAKTVSPSAWVEFKEGISFQLRFMPKSRFRALADKCTSMLYDEKAKARVPKLDSDEFTRLFVKEAVLNWKGVSLRSLSRISEIDISGYVEEQMDIPLPFSPGEMIKLLDMVYDLDGFINQAVADIRTFRPTLEEEAKNLKSSPTTS